MRPRQRWAGPVLADLPSSGQTGTWVPGGLTQGGTLALQQWALLEH
jgi:hypothetical protein